MSSSYNVYLYVISQDEKAIDPFVMYSPTYDSLREVVHKAAFEDTHKGLTKSVEVRELRVVMEESRRRKAERIAEELEGCKENVINFV